MDKYKRYEIFVKSILQHMVIIVLQKQYKIQNNLSAPSGCITPGMSDRTKSSGVMYISYPPASPSFFTFKVAKYRKILSGVE